MTPSQILLGAADHIRQYGHQKGRFGAYGDPCCLLGAIEAIVFRVGIPVELTSYTAAISLVGGALKVGYDRVAIVTWNDRAECMKEDVLALLDRVGAEAERHENRTEPLTFQQAIDRAVKDHPYMIKRYNVTSNRRLRRECVSWIVGCAYGYLMVARIPTGPDAYDVLKPMAQKALRKGKKK